MELILNPNKRIGQVIFFTEGVAEEPELLEAVFCNTLGYDLIFHEKNGLKISHYKNKDDPYSRVYVVPMLSSAIVNIPGEEEFLDDIYQQLKTFGLDGNKARIFYLFDRDPQSNKSQAVENKISLLRNPLDNDENLPGALLLSYPCLQAYYVQAHNDSACFRLGKEIKRHVNSHNYKALSEINVMSAASNMLRLLNDITGKPFDPASLNDYSRINTSVYNFEEAYWTNHYHEYKTLSLLSLAFIDLGLLIISSDNSDACNVKCERQ